MMPAGKTHLYARIKCPYCKWHTTAAEAIGEHLVDKHSDKVVKGYIKIKTQGTKKKGK